MVDARDCIMDGHWQHCIMVGATLLSGERAPGNGMEEKSLVLIGTCGDGAMRAGVGGQGG